MRPDGIAVHPPIGNKAGVYCILEYKRMSDITDQYLLRAKLAAENQYVSLRSALSDAIHRQVWKVELISFATGSRSVNEQDLRKNLKFFRVPEASIQSIYSKLVMRVFDVYANILKCMYSTRFSGGPTRSGASSESQSTSNVVTPLIRTLDTSRPDK
jgi:hydrogenase maturation factor HypF (carbamoyltransferase family)